MPSLYDTHFCAGCPRKLPLAQKEAPLPLTYLLSCGDSLCKDCIAKATSQGKCPSCSTAIPSHWDANNIDIFGHGLHVMGKTKTKEIKFKTPGRNKVAAVFGGKVNTEVDVCSFCSNSARQRFICIDCMKWICLSCRNAHHMSEIAHRIIPLGHDDNFTVCPHSITNYCLQCLFAGCSDCVALVCKHNPDNVDLSTKLANQKSSEFQKKMGSIKSKLKTKYDSEKMNLDQIANKVNRHFRRLHGILQLKEEQILQQLYSKGTSRLQEINTMIHAIDNIASADRKYTISSNESQKSIFKKLCFATQGMEMVDDVEVDSDPKFKLHCAEEFFTSAPVNIEEIPATLKFSFQSQAHLENNVKSAEVYDKMFHEANETIHEQPVILTHINSPKSFYLRSFKQKKLLPWIQTIIAQFMANDYKPSPDSSYIKKGNIVFARFEEVWYRAQIVKVSPGSEFEVHVLFLDYGNESLLKSKDLISNPPERFKHWPPLAVHCTLPNFSSEFPWDATDTTYFTSLVQSQEIKAKVINDDVTPFVIDLYSRSDSIAKIIHDSKQPKSGSLIRNDLRQYPESQRLLIDSTYDIFVAEIRGVKEFYVQRISQLEELNALNRRIREYCQDCVNFERLVPHIGMPCLAIFEVDKTWYRGLISNVFGVSRMVTVEFIDYGNHESISFDNIRWIPDEFMKFPRAAILSELIDVKCKTVDFEKATLDRFKELAYNKNGTVTVSQRRDEECPKIPPVFLTVESLELMQYIDVNRVLVEEGLCLPGGLDATHENSSIRPNRNTRRVSNLFKESTLAQQPELNESIDANLEVNLIPEIKLPAISICMFKSPSLFAIRNCTASGVDPIIEMSKKLCTLIQMNNVTKFSGLPEITNEHCHIVFDCTCSLYKRCKIERRFEDHKTAVLYLIDYADVGTADISSIYNCSGVQQLLEEGPLCKKVSLRGVVSPGDADSWPHRSIEFCEEHISRGVQFYVRCDHLGNQEILPVDLFVVESSSRNQGNVLKLVAFARLLVADGIAVPTRVESIPKDEIVSSDNNSECIQSSMDNLLSLELPLRDEKKSSTLPNGDIDLEETTSHKPISDFLYLSVLKYIKPSVPTYSPGLDSSLDAVMDFTCILPCDLLEDIPTYNLSRPDKAPADDFFDFDDFAGDNDYSDCIDIYQPSSVIGQSTAIKFQANFVDKSFNLFGQDQRINPVLIQKINDDCKRECLGVLPIEPHHFCENMCGCAAYNKSWYRARVISVCLPKLFIQYVDYGNFETIDSKFFLPFKDIHVQVPSLSIKARLSGLITLVDNIDDTIFSDICQDAGTLLILKEPPPEFGSVKVALLAEPGVDYRHRLVNLNLADWMDDAEFTEKLCFPLSFPILVQNRDSCMPAIFCSMVNPNYIFLKLRPTAVYKSNGIIGANEEVVESFIRYIDILFSKSYHLKKPASLEEGLCVLVKQSVDESVQRGQIMKIINDDTISVYLVDSGLIIQASPTELFAIQQEGIDVKTVLSMTALAIPCDVVNLKSTSTTGSWSIEALDLAKKCLADGFDFFIHSISSNSISIRIDEKCFQPLVDANMATIISFNSVV